MGKDKDKSLINDLESLSSKDILVYDNHKKKKKKKKKDSDVLEFIRGDVEAYVIKNGDEEHQIEDLEDLCDILENSDPEDFSTGIIRANKTSRKNSENEFRKEFNDDIALLYDLLESLKSLDNDLSAKFAQTSGKNIRGVSKYTIDLAAQLLNCKNNQANVIRQITMIKESAEKLKISNEKNNPDNSNNIEFTASSILSKIMGGGRKNFIDQLDNASYSISNDYSNSYDDDFIDQLTGSLAGIENEQSEELNKYVKYESLEPKLLIERNIDTGDWRFMAMSKDEQEIPDYPLPDKADSGITFTDDGDYATDKYGRRYKVISILG